EEDQVKKNHLYQCVLAAGYEPEEKGICFGLSLLVIQSILAGNFADFQKKLGFILSSRPDTLGMEIKNARKRKKTAEISSLTADELYLLEIDSLLMGIAIHSKPEAFPHLFETGAQTVTQNAKRTFPLTQ